MVAAQTGTGKTGGFALPVLELLFPGGHPDREHRYGPKQPRVLVLTPTRGSPPEFTTASRSTPAICR